MKSFRAVGNMYKNHHHHRDGEMTKHQVPFITTQDEEEEEGRQGRVEEAVYINYSLLCEVATLYNRLDEVV